MSDRSELIKLQILLLRQKKQTCLATQQACISQIALCDIQEQTLTEQQKKMDAEDSNTETQ